MNNMTFIKIFLVASICIFVMDMIWLGYIGKNIYAEQIGSFLRKSPDGSMAPIWSAAIIVYIALVAGLIFFVLPKAGSEIYLACIWGSVFGLIVYAVYDFTNLSILAGWPLKITLIDVIWGGILCGVTSGVTVAFKNWLLG